MAQGATLMCTMQDGTTLTITIGTWPVRRGGMPASRK
jgi:hypothetical protein